jgi:hypothetical protein
MYVCECCVWMCVSVVCERVPSCCTFHIHIAITAYTLSLSHTLYYNTHTALTAFVAPIVSEEGTAVYFQNQSGAGAVTLGMIVASLLKKQVCSVV